MMYVGEEYQVLVSVLKVFCSIGEKKWLHWIQKVDLLDDGSRTKVTPVENQIQSLILHLIQLETMLIRL